MYGFNSSGRPVQSRPRTPAAVVRHALPARGGGRATHALRGHTPSSCRSTCRAQGPGARGAQRVREGRVGGWGGGEGAGWGAAIDAKRLLGAALAARRIYPASHTQPHNWAPTQKGGHFGSGPRRFRPRRAGTTPRAMRPPAAVGVSIAPPPRRGKQGRVQQARALQARVRQARARRASKRADRTTRRGETRVESHHSTSLPPRPSAHFMRGRAIQTFFPTRALQRERGHAAPTTIRCPQQAALAAASLRCGAPVRRGASDAELQMMRKLQNRGPCWMCIAVAPSSPTHARTHQLLSSAVGACANECVLWPIKAPWPAF